MKYDILPIRTAFFWIFVSTMLISGTAGVSLWVYQWHANQITADEKYRITSINQQTSSEYRLPTGYLSELLELSVDAPAVLPKLSLQRSLNRLLSSPVIETANVKKIPPRAIHVDYSMRQPIAKLVEYKNTLLDKNAFPFPSHPFYCDLNLPEVVLGDIENPLVWGAKISDTHVKYAIAVYEAFKTECSGCQTTIKRIDISKANDPSAGHREIILTLQKVYQGQFIQDYIRLGLDQYGQNLHRYAILEEHLIKKKNFFQTSFIIDLRVPQLAFLSAVL